MTAYTFRIWFSGLVHFVENRDPNAKCQLCVVLPQADCHCGAIYEPRRVVECGRLRLRAGRQLLALGRRRVAFKITRFDDVPPLHRPFLSDPLGIINLDQIAGIFVDEYDRIVSSDSPPPDVVQAQILLEEGYDFGIDWQLSILRDWTLPGTLTGGPTTVSVADPVFIDIPNVVKVEMLNSDLDSTATPHYQELAPGGNGYIEILVSNRCPYRYLEPGDIVVRRGSDNRLTILQLDTDFAFNYRMLSPTTLEALGKILPPHGQRGASAGPRFPVPESPLVEIVLAPHLCPPCLAQIDDGQEEAKTPDEPETGNAKKESAAIRVQELVRETRQLFPLLQGEQMIDIVVIILNKLLGTGTGSGSDCLGSRGKARFLGLDAFIPSPAPPLSPASVQARARAERRNPSSQPIPEAPPPAPDAKEPPAAQIEDPKSGAAIRENPRTP